MYTIRKVVPPLLAAFLIGACGAPPAVSPATATDSVLVSPPATATIEPSPVPIAATVDPAVYAAGGGLSLSTSDGLWQVKADGGMSAVVEQGSARLSPDSQEVAFLQPDPDTGVDDVWLLDLATGVRTNLTNTPDRYETVPMWWPGRSGVVVFGSDTGAGMENSDYPTLVNIDGSGYQVLDPSQGDRERSPLTAPPSPTAATMSPEPSFTRTRASKALAPLTTVWMPTDCFSRPSRRTGQSWPGWWPKAPKRVTAASSG